MLGSNVLIDLSILAIAPKWPSVPRERCQVQGYTFKVEPTLLGFFVGKEPHSQCRIRRRQVNCQLAQLRDGKVHSLKKGD